ncbi:hypothetical protein AVEN_79326-1 [Araneus ventricosus]|uniref:Spidroin N-terminal domain-containing protein n=1 Tax=Araneus ventricosus TaxID=182803 RepID=A0A4Y2JZE6_ARAVE|nr:hypothetical protein AVEN_79326-1 [Araneus ventricosus]
MNWKKSSLLLLLLTALCINVSAAQNVADSPWSSNEKADFFIRSFNEVISRSSAFTSQQIDDMTSIGDTLITSIDNMAKSGKSSTKKLQALNMAFASSMAEIAVAEQGGQNIDVKTNAIIDALNEAFIRTSGRVNNEFISEIRQLILMFSQVSMNDSASGSTATASAGATVGGSVSSVPETAAITSTGYTAGQTSYQSSYSLSSTGSNGLQNYGIGQSASSSTAATTSGTTGYGSGQSGSDTSSVAVGDSQAYGPGQFGYSGQQGYSSSTSSIAISLGYDQNGYGSGSGAGSGAGQGQGSYGGQLGGQGASAAASVESAGASGTSSGTGQGQAGYSGQIGGPGSSAATSSAPSRQGYAPGQGQLLAAGSSSSSAAAATSSSQGYGPGQSSYAVQQGSARAASAATASAAASRLSWADSFSRVSSAVSSLVSNGPTNPVALANAVSSVMSQVNASSSGLSECDVLVQALLEILSAFVHILGSATVGEVSYDATSPTAQVVSQSIAQVFA